MTSDLLELFLYAIGNLYLMSFNVYMYGSMSRIISGKMYQNSLYYILLLGTSLK